MNNLPVLKQLNTFFGQVITWLAQHLAFLGSHRWAVSIILLTIIVRTALLPLAVKQIRSTQATQRLQPEIKRLQQKYKNDKQKLNTEMMELWKREGVNPLAGCIPVIAQMPILFAMYYAIRNITTPIAIGGHGVTNMPFLGIANGCAKEILKLHGKATQHVTLCGLAAPTTKTVAGIILLVLMTATSYLSTKQMTAGQDAQQARIAQLMPLMFVFIMIRFPAALVLYWTVQNIYQLVQQTLMLRKHPPPAPAKHTAKPKPKSKR